MRVANPATDLTKEQALLWHRILHKKGWIAPLWPKEYGGPGWSITKRFIWEQETSRAGTLPPLAFSVTMVGPVIYTFGTDAQKQNVIRISKRLALDAFFQQVMMEEMDLGGLIEGKRDEGRRMKDGRQG